MRVVLKVELDLPAGMQPDKLPNPVYLDREASLRVLNLLLGNLEDGVSSTPV